MTEIIYYHKKNTQNDVTVSVILYNSVYKQYLFNRNIHKLAVTGWWEMSNIIKVHNTWKKIVYDKLRLLFIGQ